MIFDDWKEVTLSEICLEQKGSYGIGASAVDYSEDLYTYLRITDITDDGKLIKSDLKSVSDEKADQYLLQPNDIVFARTGNSTGKSYFYDGSDGELVYAGFLIKFSLDPKKVNPKFIRFYTLSDTYKGWVKSFSTGSTRGNINAQTYANMRIKLPSKKLQDLMVDILSKLEEKEKLNADMINNLEELSQTFFKHWFLDFEFPNEDGLPYKSSGGKMVESELGEIPEGWDTGKLNDIYFNFDSKRIPLSKLEREKREKIYPYYGAASLMDYVDDYIFDGIYLLLGEDGTVVTGEGFPILQYVWDKLWVNNHAHVMQGKNGFTTEYLYNLLKQTKITDIITGAVQQKISQKNLNNIDVFIPNSNLLKLFDEMVQPIYQQLRNLSNENKRLQELRDSLLPKLLSGEIEIPEESVVD